jgi:alkylation response protein AidB-like acyl-CoA dehydrogenase
MAKIKAGQLPGPEMSIAKLAGTQNMQRVAAMLGRVLGPRLVADSGEWGTYAWAEFVLGVPGARIAGGTDEVMRNIVGERVLGLPKEPRVDTGAPGGASAFGDGASTSASGSKVTASA